MIFSPISEFSDKSLFEELIQVYIKIATSYAAISNLAIPSAPDRVIRGNLKNELFDIGIARSDSDICDLARFLGKTLYAQFIDAVNFVINNRSCIGHGLDNLNNKRRAQLQTLEYKSGKPTVADFFAGAGGLSKGFSNAGYRIAFANDFQSVCVSTYRYNHPELPANHVSNEDIRKIVDQLDDYLSEPIDIVIGGPPCQGFSPANQQPIIDDPRNELYKYYLKAVRKILPKFVLMENVRGMMSVADQVCKDFESINVSRGRQRFTYKVAYRLLNALDFGVAQNRERLIYIAVRSDVQSGRRVTPEKIFAEIEKNYHCSSPFLLSDALEGIRPLSAPRIKNQNEVDSEEWGSKIEPNRFHGNENAYLRKINGGRIIPLMFNHRARYLSDVNFDIYRLLNQGDDATDEKIARIMPYAHRNHCFKDKYFKLFADRPSRTITAHLKMDCHSHIHPFQIRALTPREAARCQSFPDDYLFLGAYLKTYMEIGNAVPVLMAEGIARTLKRFL